MKASSDMPTLTRDDVTIVSTDAQRFLAGDDVWHIRIGDDDYRIIAYRDGDGDMTRAYRSTRYGAPDGVDEDLLKMASAPGLDHWDCIDLLTAWLSIDVEDGWCRPVYGVSHRIDLPAAQLVVLFTPERGVPYTFAWTIRDLGNHFEAYRDDDGEPDFGDVYPAALYVRVGDRLVPAIHEVRHLDGDLDELSVLVDGAVVAAVRY